MGRKQICGGGALGHERKDWRGGFQRGSPLSHLVLLHQYLRFLYLCLEVCGGLDRQKCFVEAQYSSTIYSRFFLFASLTDFYLR